MSYETVMWIFVVLFVVQVITCFLVTEEVEQLKNKVQQLTTENIRLDDLCDERVKENDELLDRVHELTLLRDKHIDILHTIEETINKKNTPDDR